MDIVTEPVLGEVSSSEGVRKLKRTATIAGLDDTQAVDCSSTSPQNPDHDDYVAKKKPRRAAAGKAEVVKKGAAAGAKDERYRERRIKNNIASKRSRETRKMKYTAMEQKAIDLEASNEELEQRVEELEALTKRMKEVLVKRLSQSACIATG